jgi:hypothetical protein
MESTYPPPLPTAPALTNVRTWTALYHASALLGVLLHFPGHLAVIPLVSALARDDARVGCAQLQIDAI